MEEMLSISPSQTAVKSQPAMEEEKSLGLYGTSSIKALSLQSKNLESFLSPGGIVAYFIGQASPELAARYIGEQGVAVNLKYISFDSSVSHYEPCEISPFAKHREAKSG